MPDLTIVGLPNATTPLSGTERVPLTQSGTTKDCAVSDLASFATGPAGPTGATGATGPPGASGPPGPGGASGLIPINSQTGTAYTLVPGDSGYCVEMNNASANTLTVPPNSTVAFPLGTNILVRQMGAGLTTVAAGAGVTIRTPLTLAMFGRYATASLHKRGTDEWCFDGNIA